MDEQPDENISKIAAEIIRYLITHENAADTVEGVSGWWIAQQRFEESQQQVQKALEFLCQQGIVEAVPLAGGKLLYSLNKER